MNPGASYTYDSDRKLTAMTAPGTQLMGQSSFSWTSGPSYQYSYDIAGRPTGMNQWDPVNQVWNTVTGNGTFNAAGQMTGWQEYGYCNLSRSYDPARGWMTGLTASGSLNLSYAYNSGGQVTSVTDTINPGQGVTSYTYDNLDRLGSATTPNWGLSWTYDGFGNRLTQSGTGTAASVTQTLGYDGTSNHITSISTYFYGIGYDANGNASQIPGTNGQYSYLSLAYDVFDRVIHESGNYMGAGPSTAYDAFGRRIAKNLTDGTTRIYFYDPAGREVAEYNFNPNATCNYSGTYYTCTALGSPTATYTYFAGQRVGQWTDRVGSRRYTPVGSTASSYYPYGEDVTGNPTNNDTYKFASLYRDSDSGLDYANARFYASGIGRFLTGDSFDASASPSSPQSWNRYAYVQNDPVNFYDPSGRLLAAVGDCGDSWISDASLEGPCDMGGGWGFWGAVGGAVAAAGSEDSSGDSSDVSVPRSCGDILGIPSAAEAGQLAVVLGENSFSPAFGATDMTIATEDLYMEQAMYNYATRNGTQGTGTTAYVSSTINTDTYRGYPAGVGTLGAALASTSTSDLCWDLEQAETAYGDFWNGSHHFSNVNQWRSFGSHGARSRGDIKIGNTVFYYNPNAYYSRNRHQRLKTPPIVLPKKPL